MLASLENNDYVDLVKHLITYRDKTKYRYNANIMLDKHKLLKIKLTLYVQQIMICRLSRGKT